MDSVRFALSEMTSFGSAIASVGALLMLSACTGQLPGSFRYAQQEETFSSSTQVNTRLDILWVVDNSGSMADKQLKIRQGFSTFAAKYMQPTWDIRLAVITTDVYLANPVLSNWLGSTISSSGGYVSNYVNGITSGSVPGRASPLTNPNPPWAPNMYVWDGSVNRWKIQSSGITIKQSRPYLGPNWAKLLDVDPLLGVGNHDGPPTLLCNERTPSQMASAISGTGLCYVRDDIYRVSPPVNTGVSHCVSPATGESHVSQCVNTGMNGSVHSGKSILSTYGSDSATLVQDFITNVTVGDVGTGVERSMNSIQQFVADNEATSSSTKFFRPDSLRVIIIVSDEEDQSIVMPASTQINPTTYLASSCPKSVQRTDGTYYNYTIAKCPDATKTFPTVGAPLPPAEMASQLNSFFRTLDGDPAGNPNYFVAVITPLTGETTQALGDQATHDLEFANAVGNGSLGLELNSTDYTPLLNAIGQVIVQKKAVFTLNHPPSGSEDMIVTILHEDGSSTLIPASSYTIDDKTLTITDDSIVLGLKATDQIQINYQPKSLN